ncbi:MAG: SDR family oxidoreductase [Actinobacteria bacterium]|nr:SDR family oxidoreductase [Actinomycetota bacterium]
MKVCVLGAGGLLGHMLIRVLGESFDVYGSTRESATTSSPLAKFLPQGQWIGEVDASKPASINKVFDADNFDVVINCVGLIKQRNSQVTDDEMMSINGEFPHYLAQVANSHGAKVIHISTDCVFSGLTGNYFETETPDPIDVYGKSKLLGELNDTRNLTLRTSHIGRELTTRKSFVDWLLSQRGGRVYGYSHAIYSGLTTRELSRLIGGLMHTNFGVTGLFHVSSEPISKLEIINKLNELLDLQIVVTPDSSVKVNRSLNSEKFQALTSITPTSWDTMLAEFCQDQKIYE